MAEELRRLIDTLEMKHLSVNVKYPENEDGQALFVLNPFNMSLHLTVPAREYCCSAA